MTDPDEATLLNAPGEAEPPLRRFSQAEMITCEACLRANPPTRPNCFYCGAALLVSPAIQSAETAGSRTPESGSNGCFIVISQASREPITASSLEPLVARLNVKPADLQNALSRGGPLPVSIEAMDQTSSLMDELRTIGLETVSITEEEISSLPVPKKIRALEFSDHGLTGLTKSSGEQFSVTWDELSLMVVGRLQSHQVELIERRKRGGAKPLDRRELSGDESVLDLYGKSGQEGWRITAGNFDFSSLGPKKGITTFENFRALVAELRERAPHLEVDEGYLPKRALLANVWPLGEGTQTGGLRRSGTGKFDVSTLTTTDNENQFNNYSRLVNCLKLRELAS